MVRLVFLAAGADDGVNVKETIQYVTLSLFVYVFMSSRRCEARFRHYRAYTSFHMTSMTRRFIGRPENTFELVVLREQTHASGVHTANTRLKLSTELSPFSQACNCPPTSSGISTRLWMTLLGLSGETRSIHPAPVLSTQNACNPALRAPVTSKGFLQAQKKHQGSAISNKRQ